MIRSKEARYCILRDSEYIKETVKYKMKEFGLNITKLASHVSASDYRIGRYLRSPHYSSLSSITQHQLVEICEFLGLEVEVLIKVKYSKPKHLR